MICDDCKHRDKCTKIISESATDCVDKSGNRLAVALPNGKTLVCYSSCPDRSWHSADTSKTVKMLTKVLQSYEMYNPTMLENISAWREACNTSRETNHDL